MDRCAEQADTALAFGRSKDASRPVAQATEPLIAV